MNKNKEEIPIMFCFDNNYVIPAAVAFYSLLEHANKDYHYTLYVLHTDITEKNQKRLQQTINEFSDFSELIFVNMENKFSDLWEVIETKGHFSKEVMYKILVASIFPKYEKIITSDVDVVFLDDISDSYISFDVNQDYYLAGTKMIGKMKWYLDQYLDRFTEEEVEKLSGFCGGYIVFNLKKLREDKMEEKFVKCFETDGYRINQMEQDVLNLCCYPKTKKLPLKYVACSYMWDEYKTEEDKETDIWYKKEEIEEAMNCPIQLHYATSVKPWKNVDCTKSEIWFHYLLKTPFVEEYLKSLPYKIDLPLERIQKIKQEAVEEAKDGLVQELTQDILKKNSFKGKVANKFGSKKWYRALKYIKNNPLFLFQKSFYKKLSSKINKKKVTLVILDDTFPSPYSSFRYEEYMEYLRNIEEVYVLTTGTSLPALNETRNLEEVIQEFEKTFPEYAGKVKKMSSSKDRKALENLPNKLAIVTFVNNLVNPIYDNIALLEKYKIPFIFTLYPGGGFSLNNEKSDQILRRACSSPYFQKVIVTQKNTKEYLIDNKICKEEQIEFIYGIVTPKVLLENDVKEKCFYGKGKDTLDICFIAHKYSPQGKDKGYDLFIEMAKQLNKRYDNIQYHVVGEFSEEDISTEGLEHKIHFYGTKVSKWFIDFYKKMDIIVSPTRPFMLTKGSFDGFPTGCCTEAMLNKVAVVCTDELKLNIVFKEGKEIILVKPKVEDIVSKIETLYKEPKQLEEVAIKGSKAAHKYYGRKKQIIPRIKLIRKVAKNYYSKKRG